MPDLETKKLLSIAAAVAAAGAAFLGPIWSRDLANHIAMWDPSDATETYLEGELRRRMAEFGMPCGDTVACSRAMIRAYNRGRVGLVAAGKSGPAWGVPPGSWIAATGRA